MKFLDLPGGNHLLMKLTTSLRPIRAVHKLRKMWSSQFFISLELEMLPLFCVFCVLCSFGSHFFGPLVLILLRREAQATKRPVRIASKDKDLLQLVSRDQVGKVLNHLLNQNPCNASKSVQSKYWLSAKGETRNQLQDFDSTEISVVWILALP